MRPDDDDDDDDGWSERQVEMNKIGGLTCHVPTPHAFFNFEVYLTAVARLGLRVEGGAQTDHGEEQRDSDRKGRQVGIPERVDNSEVSGSLGGPGGGPWGTRSH